LDNSIIVYKLGSESDVFFYVVGSADEVCRFSCFMLAICAQPLSVQNELILQAALDAFSKALSSLLK
jgi:hypothetical protein